MTTYEGQVVLVAPDFLKEKWPTGIGIDVCLALEIQNLWKAGIKTTGHCCGHGRSFPYIGVCPEHIEQMKAMGYEVQPNPCRPGDEDSFVPKTRLSDAIERGAAQGVRDRAAMIVEGWSTAQNHLPDGVDGGWLAERDLEMGKAIRSLSTPPAPAPDAGEEWKLVPIKPTEKMVDESDYAMTIAGEHDGEALTIWNAMLAAAPSPAPQTPAVEAEAEKPVGFMRSKDNDGNAFWCGKSRTGYYDVPVYSEAAIKAKTDENERLRRERDAARQALEHDRSKAIAACNEFSDAFKRRSWLLESRGSYEWDDDRYRDEFRQAYDEMVEPINRFRDIGRDWSNCPTNHEEIMRSRQNWQSRAEAAEASNKALRERPPRVSGISFEVATNLLESFGGDDTDMTLEFIEDGHSGTGFYAWCTEYPEDGSTFVGKASEFSPLSARALLSETGGE